MFFFRKFVTLVSLKVPSGCSVFFFCFFLSTRIPVLLLGEAVCQDLVLVRLEADLVQHLLEEGQDY